MPFPYQPTSELGLSWKTNQYGLAIDNVKAFELVLPNGSVVTATEASHEDLFFGLKVSLFVISDLATHYV